MYIAVFIGAVLHSKRYTTVSYQSATSPAGKGNENSNTLQISVGTVRSQIVNNRREMRLAVSGFFVFISMFMYFLFVVLVLTTGNADFDDGVMYNIVCDIFSCINPYALLLLSKQTRIAFMRTLQCKKSS
uniref:G-protein coupled receptors family 1 profile domain-containing protein n=1 Tax=Plectus sambesii TaxID=2011161 RepID=A0A914X5L8_9BILA